MRSIADAAADQRARATQCSYLSDANRNLFDDFSKTAAQDSFTEVLPGRWRALMDR